jgi:hypothetical protein
MNACCGLNCEECPTFRATIADDDAVRKKVAEKWSQFFGQTLAAKDINCDGCLSGSERMFKHCRQCTMRSCCQEKGFDTCAECNDYPCPTLNGFFTMMPAAQKGMDAIRKNMTR